MFFMSESAEQSGDNDDTFGVVVLGCCPYQDAIGLAQHYADLWHIPCRISLKKETSEQSEGNHD
jgi:hypothetical protein